MSQKPVNKFLWVWNSRFSEGYPGDEYVDVISVDVYPEEYKATDYAGEYDELIRNTSDSVGNLRRMYSSSYAIQGKGLIK